jgi:hypothetical protein
MPLLVARALPRRALARRGAKWFFSPSHGLGTAFVAQGVAKSPDTDGATTRKASVLGHRAVAQLVRADGS